MNGDNGLLFWFCMGNYEDDRVLQAKSLIPATPVIVQLQVAGGKDGNSRTKDTEKESGKRESLIQPSVLIFPRIRRRLHGWDRS